MLSQEGFLITFLTSLLLTWRQTSSIFTFQSTTHTCLIHPPCVLFCCESLGKNKNFHPHHLLLEDCGVSTQHSTPSLCSLIVRYYLKLESLNLVRIMSAWSLYIILLKERVPFIHLSSQEVKAASQASCWSAVAVCF
jgi:hypothetical protein